MTTHLTRVDMRVLFSMKKNCFLIHMEHETRRDFKKKHRGANYLLEQVSNDRRGKGTINIQITQ